MKIKRYWPISLVPRFATLLSAILLLWGTLSLHAQLTPYNPNKLAELQKKLNQAEIKSEKIAVLLDLHDQFMYSNSKKAYKYNDQALNIAKQIKNKALLARAYGNKGNEHFDAANLSKSLFYYQKSSSLINKEDQPLLMALNFSNMSNVFALVGDNTTSMEYGYTAIDLCKKDAKGLNLICHTRANLAETYINLGQFEKAEYLLKLNLKALKTIVSPTVSSMTLRYLGIVYKNKQNYPKAIEYVKQALQQIEPLGLDYFIAATCASLSGIYLNNGHPDLALPYARRAQKLSIINEDAQIQTLACDDLARIFISQNRLDSANLYVQRALFIAQRKGIQSLKPSVLRTYAEVLKQQQRFEASLDALLTARKLSDSIYSEESRMESTMRLEAFSELETRQKMDLRYADQLNTEKNLSRITFNVFGLALLIGLGVYSLYRQRQSVNKVLTQKKERIEVKRAELLHLNQIKEQLFTAISLELRMPLQYIQQVLANMDQRTKPVTPEQESMILGQLHQQTVRTITLLEDLLFAARVQMRQYQPLRQEFQLKALTAELEKNLRLLSSRPFLPITYQVPDELYLYSDITMLKMALRNLLLIVTNRPDRSNLPVLLSAWRQDDYVSIRIAASQPEEEYLPYTSTEEVVSPKSYWDYSLIKTFVESNNGKIYACPMGSGYDIIIPDSGLS